MRNGTLSVERVIYPDLTVQTTANISSLLRVKTVTGDYTITEDDVLGNWMIRVFSPLNAEAFITIPIQQVGVFNTPLGSKFILSSAGFGKVTVNNTPVTLNFPPQGRTIERKFGRITVVYTTENTWDIDGQLGV